MYLLLLQASSNVDFNINLHPRDIIVFFLGAMIGKWIWGKSTR